MGQTKCLEEIKNLLRDYFAPYTYEGCGSMRDDHRCEVCDRDSDKDYERCLRRDSAEKELRRWALGG